MDEVKVDSADGEKVKIRRREGAGLAVHNAFEECMDKDEKLWSDKPFDGDEVVDRTQLCDSVIGAILPSSFLCNPFIHVELFGKGFHFKGETASFGAPRRDEFLFSNDKNTIELGRNLKTKKTNNNDESKNNNNSNEELQVFKLDRKELHMVIQIMDDEGAAGRDRVIGETIVTFLNFDENKRNYMRVELFEPRELRACGILYLTGEIDNTTEKIPFLKLEFNGIKNFGDLNAHLVKDDTYTEKRNDLIILTCWVLYMIFACVLYVFLEKEAQPDYVFGDYMYMRVVTAFTVGYGDIYPITRAGKIFNAIFIIIDTITLGYIAGKVMKYIIQFREKKQIENENAEMEKENEEANNDNSDNNENELNEPKNVSKQKSGSRSGRGGGGGGNNAGSGSDDEHSVPQTPRTKSRSRADSHINTGIAAGAAAAGGNTHRAHHESDETKMKMYYIGIAVLMYVIVGTLFFHFYEGFDVASSFEWNFVTLSTVGYGNVSPQTPLGKIFTCIYIATGVTTLAYFATTVFEYIEDKKAEAYREQMIAGALINEAQLLEFDTDGDGKIDKFEFLSKMVVMTGECEQEKIDEIMAKFDELDEDKGGTISVDELRKFEQTQQKKNN